MEIDINKLAGFGCAKTLRGINWQTHVPTSLLTKLDALIGQESVSEDMYYAMLSRFERNQSLSLTELNIGALTDLLQRERQLHSETKSRITHALNNANAIIERSKNYAANHQASKVEIEIAAQKSLLKNITRTMLGEQ